MTRYRDLGDGIAQVVGAGGVFVVAVRAGAVPCYLYTVGLRDRSGHEAVLAGSAGLSMRAAEAVLRSAAADLADDPSWGVRSGEPVSVGQVDASWSRRQLLAASAHHGQEAVPAMQVRPEGYSTVDVPDLASEYDSSAAGAWRWLDDDWPYEIPRGAMAMVDASALRGEPVVKVNRWEPGYWEASAVPGPQVDQASCALVPMTVLTEHDPTAEPILHLGVGAGSFRTGRTAWRPWSRRPSKRREDHG